MRMLILMAVIIAGFTAEAQNSNPQFLNTLKDVKNIIGYHSQIVYVLGIDSANDFKGCFMQYDTSYNGAFDNMNSAKPDSLGVGRHGGWLRKNSGQIVYPSGTFYKVGSERQLTGIGTTDANGQITVIATTTGTTAGTSLFSTISEAVLAPLPGGATGIKGGLNSVSSDGKTVNMQMETNQTYVIALVSFKAPVYVAAGVQMRYTIKGF